MEFNHEAIREEKAIKIFVALFKGTYQKLAPTDVDYKVFDRDGNLLSYVEVTPRLKNISNSYPLVMNARAMQKLVDKRHNPYVVFACDDGIIYANAGDIFGEIRWAYPPQKEGGRDLIIYFEKQKGFKYVRYV